MTEMMAFARRPNESINALLSRHEVARQRAAAEGQFVMSIEGLSLHILRCCNVNSQQLIQFLQPFAGRLLTNEVQFRELTSSLRRVGHILEHTPSNIAQSLHNNRQSRPGQYWAQEEHGWNNEAGTTLQYQQCSTQTTWKCNSRPTLWIFKLGNNYSPPHMGQRLL